MTRFIGLFVVGLLLSSCASDGVYEINDTMNVHEKAISCKFMEKHGAWEEPQISLISGPLNKVRNASTDEYYCAVHRATRDSNGVFESLPDKVFKTWVDPNTGYTHSIMPIATRVAPGSPPCRVFQTTNYGKFTAVGMVCRDAYGRWRVVN